jgi:anti-sigma regulatory factor (Ser/Thr protein kinase)
MRRLDAMSCEQLLAAETPIPLQDARESQHIHLSPLPTAVREARSFVRSVRSWLDDERLHDLVMLTSELVTNAVLHARTPLQVGMTVSDSVVLICVGDRSQREPDSPEASDRRENGRGIMLVRDLADEWGVLPLAGSPGTAVWFSFRRRSDARAA